MSEFQRDDRKPAGEPGNNVESAGPQPGGHDTADMSRVWGATINLAGDASPMMTLKEPDDVAAKTKPDIAPAVQDETLKLPGGLAPLEAGKTRLDLMVAGLPKSDVSGLADGHSGGDVDTSTRIEQPGRADGDDSGTAPSPDPRSDLLNAEFTILRHLASGGMGDVYEANQSGLDRVVAFKVPKFGANTDVRHAVEEFVQEAAVAGDLEHPNIVPIYKSGTSHSGKPFYAMKRVKGIEWRFLLHPEMFSQSADAEARARVESRAAEMTLNDHIEILIKSADAVAFAHSRGIIHRDLKPENVMVGAYGEVLVMDWGLALDVSDRNPEEVKARHISQIIAPAGTPAYMAPEMAECKPEKIGKHSDIYLLGAMLYEVITGTPPHRGDSLIEVIQDAYQGIVDSPMQRAPEREVPRGLAEIALTAMSLNPGDRYASVEDFQSALRRYRTNAQSLAISREADLSLESLREETGAAEALYPRYAEVIAAYKQAIKLWSGNSDAQSGLVRALEGFIETALLHSDLGLARAQIDHLRQTDDYDPLQVEEYEKRHARLEAQKARRRRNFLILLALAAFMLVTIIVGGILFTTRLAGEKKIAEQMRDEAERSEREAVSQKAKAEKLRDVAEAGKKKIEAQQGEIIRQRDEAERSEREAVSQKAEAVKQRDIADKQKRLAESAQGKATRAAERARQNLARVFVERAQGRLDDGRDYGAAALHLVQALKRHEKAAGARGLLARVLQIAPRLSVSRVIPGSARTVAVASDGKHTAVGTDDGRLMVLHLPDLGSDGVAVQLGSKPWAVAALSDGRWLAALDNGSAVIVPAVPDRPDAAKRIAAGIEVPATSVVGWTGHDTPQGSEFAVAIGYRDGRIVLQSLSGDNRRVFHAHWGAITALHITDDGHLVSASWDRHIKRWDLGSLWAATPDEAGGSPAPVVDLTGHSDFIHGLDVSSDGTMAISAGADRTVRLWDLARGIELQTFTGHAGPVGSVIFLRDETDTRGMLTFASQGWDGRIRLWDAHTGMITATLRVSALNRLGLAAYRKNMLLCLAEQGGLKLWNLQANARSTRLDLNRERPQSVHLDHTGARTLVYTSDGRLDIYDNASAERIQRDIGHAAFPRLLDAWFDADRVRVVLSNGRIKSWRADKGEAVEVSVAGEPLAAAFTPDGRHVAAVYADRLSIHDTKSARPRTLAAHGRLGDRSVGSAHAVAVTPDGARVAALFGGQTIVYADSKQVRFIEAPEGAGLKAVCMTPDGRYVAAAGEDRIIHIYATDNGRTVARITGHGGVITSLAITADSQTLISGSRDHTVRLWDLNSRSNWLTLNMPGGWIQQVVLSTDGARLGALTEDGRLRTWAIPTSGAEFSGDLGALAAEQFGLRLDAAGKPLTIPPGRKPGSASVGIAAFPEKK